jgi:hypothetical protein
VATEAGFGWGAGGLFSVQKESQMTRQIQKQINVPMQGAKIIIF